MIWRTFQHLSLLRGRVSTISTRSPILQPLSLSCALYLALLLMYLLYTGCFTRRSILTTTVLSILSLTTTPIWVFLLPRSLISASLPPLHQRVWFSPAQY